MTSPIRQEVALEISAETIFDTLTDATKFSALSGGAPAEIDAKDGGAFAIFGGMILGRNVELVPGKRIVQAWRVKLWPEGVYSLVRFEISGKGNEATVSLEHSGFPEEMKEHLAGGWHKNYWEPLAKLAK